MVWELNVKGGGGRTGSSVMVLLPMTTWEAAGARLMGVPDIVIAGAPGSRV